MIQHHPAVARTADGQSIDAYTLAAGALRMRVITLGGIITHLFTPDARGDAGDVVLGFDDDSAYLKDHPYLGAIIGRYGNRIAKGRFTLDGVEHTLATNNGPNHLHGGLVGYDKRVWAATPADSATTPSLRLTLRDPDGAEGYPGTLDVTVTYTLDGSRNTLRIEYLATVAGKSTPLNLTNHTYFHLRDAGATPITDHVLQLDCDRYLVGDENLIPQGEPVPVAGTPIDFRTPKPIGQDLVAMGGKPVGYDHNVVIASPVEGSTLRRAVRVEEPTSGRTMECWTDQPAVQFYSGNFLDGTLVGKSGARYAQHHGFCLETQHYPDSPNHPTYPSTILKPGETFRSATEYRFGVR